MPLLEQELLTIPQHLSSPPVFTGVRAAQSLVFCVVFCRSLFVLLVFFCWPLCCLSFVDLQIMITPLVSSNSSCNISWYISYDIKQASISYSVLEVINGVFVHFPWIQCPQSDKSCVYTYFFLCEILVIILFFLLYCDVIIDFLHLFQRRRDPPDNVIYGWYEFVNTYLKCTKEI